MQLLSIIGKYSTIAPAISNLIFLYHFHWTDLKSFTQYPRPQLLHPSKMAMV